MSTTMRDTEDDTGEARGLRAKGAERPGIIVVFAAGAPALEVLPLTRGSLTIGRDASTPTFAADTRLSRRHVEFAIARGEWTVRDLGSRNGTYVDGTRISSTTV